MKRSKKNNDAVDSFIVDLIRTRTLQVHNVYMRKKDVPKDLIEKLRSYGELKLATAKSYKKQ